MCVYRVQKGIARHTVRAGDNAVNQRPLKTSGIVWASIAANTVTAGVTQIRIINPELGMIEKVECLRTEFKNAALSYREVFQQAHIKVRSMRIVQKVAARSSKREATWRYEQIRIPQQRAKALCVSYLTRRRSWIRVHIRIRAGAHAIRPPGIVEGRNSGASLVDHAEGRARLEDRDSGKLPAVSQYAEKSRGRRRGQRRILLISRWFSGMAISPTLDGCTQVRQCVDVTDIQQVPLVEVRTRLIRAEII